MRCCCRCASTTHRRARSARSSTWPARPDPVRRLRGRRPAAGEPHARARPRAVAHHGDRGVRSPDRRRARSSRASARAPTSARRSTRSARGRPTRRRAPSPPGRRGCRAAMAQAVERFGERQRLPSIARAFTTALPAFDAFPMAQWARLSAKHWRAQRDDVMGYGEPLRPSAAAPGDRGAPARQSRHRLRRRADLHRRRRAAGVPPDRLDAAQSGRPGVVRESRRDRRAQQPDRRRRRTGAGPGRRPRACASTRGCARVRAFASRSSRRRISSRSARS